MNHKNHSQDLYNQVLEQIPYTYIPPSTAEPEWVIDHTMPPGIEEISPGEITFNPTSTGAPITTSSTN